MTPGAHALRDELLDRHFIVALALDDSPARYEEIARVVAGGGVWTGTQSGTGPDGSPIGLDLVVSPVRSETGAVVNVLAIAREVSRRRTLDPEAAREARRRGLVVAELAKLDTLEDVTTRALHIGEALLGLDAVAFSAVVAFGRGGSAELVATGTNGCMPDIEPWLSRAVVRYVKRRAQAGAWIQAPAAGSSAGQVARQLRAIGKTALGFTPIHHGDATVGVLVVGTDQAWGRAPGGAADNARRGGHGCHQPPRRRLRRSRAERGRSRWARSNQS